MAQRYEVIIRTSLDDKSLKRGQREHTTTFDKIAADAAKAAKREAEAFEKSTRARTVAEQKAAKEVERIYAQTTRQADQQARIQERAAKALAAEKQRLIKREQDEFLKAEAVKTAAAQRAAQAQIAAAERSKASMIAAWGMVKNAALLAFAGIVAAVGGLGVAIKKAMEFDVLERGLEIVAGSAVEAQKQLTRLKELARLPGLGLRQAIEASIALQIGFQTSIKDTTTRMQLSEAVIKQFSNAIALTGGGPEIFQRVITQLTQMSNAGKVLMTDLRPIIQAAPALGQSLVKAFGTISPEEINALGLSSEEFMRRWVTALETLPRATDSAANAWTNFTNAFEQALVKIGKPFLEPLTRGLNVIEPMLEAVGSKVGEVFTMLGRDGAALWANLPVETKAAFADMLSTVTGVGSQIVQWFKDNYPLIQEAVTNVLNQIAEFWKAHGDTIKKNLQLAFEHIGAVVKLGLNVLKGDWNAVGENLVAIMLVTWKRILTILQQNLNLMEGAVRKAVPVIGKIAWALGKAIAEGVWQGIKDSDTATRIKMWAIDLALAARSGLLIRSPSMVFFKIGQQIAQGLEQGIKNGERAVQIALERLLDTTRVRSVARDLVRDRRVELDLGSMIRDRRVGPGPNTDVRNRVVNPIDLEIASTYGNIIERLNSQLSRHSQLTQVQITLQQLEAAGLDDLSDSRAQEALQIAAQIDAESDLLTMREKIRDVAGDIGAIFANAVEDWSGSIGGFFKSIAIGFGDMVKRMIASTVYSGITGIFQNLLGRIFGMPTQGGASRGGILGGLFGGGGSSIFGGGTPGIAGGGGILSRLGSMFSGSSLTAPAASSAMAGGIGALGLAAGPLALGGASGGGGLGGLFSGAGGLGGMAGMLPLLGAGLGVGLGGSSGIGGILGGLGGAAAGIAGVAGLATLGIGGAGMASMAAFLAPIAGIAAIAAGPLIIGAIILAKNAARRRDEKTRNAISNDTGTAIWQLIDQARSLGLSAATQQWNAIKNNYFSQIAQIKDSKTRRHAELQWQNDFLPLWKIVEQRAKEGEKAKAFSSAFVPTFAGGAVFRSDFFLPKAAHGLMSIPGVFDRRDDLLMRVSRGEHVAVMNPDQFNRIGGTRTFQDAGVPALASGGHSGPSTTSRSEGSDIVIQSNDAAVVAILRAALQGTMTSPEGKRIIVRTVGENVDKEGMQGLLGSFARGLTVRK